MTVKISKPAVNLREELNELKKPTGIAGEAMLRAETPQEQQALVGVGRRNLIINGDMKVAQRGTSAIPTTNGAVTTCDRFMSEYTSYFTAKAEQVDDSPVGFSKSLKVTCTAVSGSRDANTYFIPFETRLENDLGIATGVGKTGTKPFTISFWIKSNQTGTKMFDVVYNNYSGNRNLSKSYTIKSADTWEYKTITFPACSASGSGAATGLKDVSFYWWMDAGSTYSGGTEQTAWGTVTVANRAAGVGSTVGVNTYFQLTGVQLEVGKVATPFEHRSYGEELALCERYFQKVPIYGESIVGQAYSTTGARFPIQLPVQMRATPTLTVPPPGSSGNSFKPLNSTLSWPGGTGANAGTALSNRHFYITCTNYSGLVAGNASTIYSASNNIFITASAEL